MALFSWFSSALDWGRRCEFSNKTEEVNNGEIWTKGDETRQCEEGWEGWGLRLSFMGVSLTCLCLHRDWAMSSPILDPKEHELVFPTGLQTRDGDLKLVCSHRYHLGLPIPILVLDDERVKFPLRDRP